MDSSKLGTHRAANLSPHLLKWECNFAERSVGLYIQGRCSSLGRDEYTLRQGLTQDDELARDETPKKIDAMRPLPSSLSMPVSGPSYSMSSDNDND